MLNRFAFDVRTGAIQVINDEMTVRNKRFVSGRVRVSKARETIPTNRQKSETGSVAKPRFSGWVEQELGTKTTRNRFATLAGRSGKQNKQIRGVARLKPRNEVLTADSPEYQPKGGRTNTSGFLRMAMRRKENRLLRVKGVFFKRRRNKLESVQIIKQKQPKRILWLRDARSNYFKHMDVDALWSRTMKSLLRPPSKL